MRVPAENLVDGRGRGLSLALRTLNTGRLTLPAACGGAMKQALAMATVWARERQQWGAPIGEHEAVAAKLAGIAADLYAVESLTWLTSALADRAELDIRLEAAMAKLFCTEALWRSADAALQIRGGRGYETALSLAGRGESPMPMERLLRDARINLIIEGTSEIMRLFIAREALDPHLNIAGASATSERIDYLGAAKFYATWYPKLFWPNFKLDGEVQLPEALRPHLHELEQDTRRLGRDLFHMIVRVIARGCSAGNWCLAGWSTAVPNCLPSGRYLPAPPLRRPRPNRWSSPTCSVARRGGGLPGCAATSTGTTTGKTINLPGRCWTGASPG